MSEDMDSDDYAAEADTQQQAQAIMFQMDTDTIMERIYRLYGTDSGILFGLHSRLTVEAIVKTVLKVLAHYEI
jgi:hypothetical protein